MNSTITPARRVPRCNHVPRHLRPPLWVVMTLALGTLPGIAAAGAPLNYTFFHAGIPGNVNGGAARIVLDNGVLPNWTTPQRWAVLGYEDSGGGGFVWTDRGVFFGVLPVGYMPRGISGAQVALQSPDITRCGWWDFNPNAWPPMPVNTTNYSPYFCAVAGLVSGINGPVLAASGQDANGDDNASKILCDGNPRVNSCNRVFLPSFGGPSTNNYARAINNNGFVVGDGATASGATRAFWFDPQAGDFDFDPTHSNYNSWASAINDSNQAVGWIMPGPCPPAPFLCFNGSVASHTYNSHYIPVAFTMGGGKGVSTVPTGLGGLGGRDGQALAINSSGWIVGWSYTSSGASHGFIYVNGVITDLNSAGAAGATGWTITDATAINDEGQIVGHATNTAGQTEVYILTP